VTATPIPIESIVIRRRTQVTPSTTLIFLGATQILFFLDTREHLDPNSNFFLFFLGGPANYLVIEHVPHFVRRSAHIGGDFSVSGRNRSSKKHLVLSQVLPEQGAEPDFFAMRVNEVFNF
jgi:hypothetical protein